MSLILTGQFLVSYIINAGKMSKKIMEALHSPPSDDFRAEAGVLRSLRCGC